MKKELTLLYVEDDKVVQENYVEIFKEYFENILVADNGNDALDLYNNNKVDVAILDISIPGINGLNVAKIIREKNDDIVLFIISAHSERDKLLQAVNLKLFAYAVKPLTHSEIISVLEEIINYFKPKNIIQITQNFSWDMEQKALFYKKEALKVTKHEKAIIDLLTKNKNIYFTSCQIQEQINLEKDNSDTDSNCNNIVQLISRFKKKVQHSCNENDFFIENCYGTGYRISF